MKNLFLFLFLAVFFGCSSTSKNSSETFDLTIKYSFENIRPGYDHLSRLIVQIDEAAADTSEKKYQSEPNEFTVAVPSGEHNIKLTALAYYNGIWESHTVENGYNADCLFNAKLNMTENKILGVKFDLKNGASLQYLK